MRLRLPTWSSLAALLVAASACGSAGTDLGQLDGQDPDGGVATQGGNGPPTTFTDPFAGAPPYKSSGGGGDNSHNAGKSCMQQGCHSSLGGKGSEAPSFLIGGTVYNDYAGTQGAPGVEVRIVDANGNALSTTSDSGGNFYISAGSAGSFAFPAVVGARDGTTSRPMITQLSSTMGSCAQASCHT
ncbi:MAG: hypothetical protein ACRELB_12270, partial [Polyangiaceae bacterium]